MRRRLGASGEPSVGPASRLQAHTRLPRAHPQALWHSLGLEFLQGAEEELLKQLGNKDLLRTGHSLKTGANHIYSAGSFAPVRARARSYCASPRLHEGAEMLCMKAISEAAFRLEKASAEAVRSGGSSGLAILRDLCNDNIFVKLRSSTCRAPKRRVCSGVVWQPVLSPPRRRRRRARAPSSSTRGHSLSTSGPCGLPSTACRTPKSASRDAAACGTLSSRRARARSRRPLPSPSPSPLRTSASRHGFPRRPGPSPPGVTACPPPPSPPLPPASPAPAAA